jgi:hypothetical protein
VIACPKDVPAKAGCLVRLVRTVHDQDTRLTTRVYAVTLWQCACAWSARIETSSPEGCPACPPSLSAILLLHQSHPGEFREIRTA